MSAKHKWKMKKQQISRTLIQALLLSLLVGCALSYTTDATPMPDLTQGSIPTHPILHPTLESSTPVVSATSTTPPTRDLPDADSILHTWDFGEKNLAFDSAFITKYGRHLVVAFFDDSMLMVDNLETGEETVFRPPVDFAFLDFTNGISSSPEGILVAEYWPNESGDVTLWQVSREGESRAVASITEAEYFVTALAISPDGKTLALGYNNGEIRLFRTGDGSKIHAVQAHNDFVMSLAFSWDSRYLLSDSCCFDPFTYVFRVSDGSKIATLATESYEPGRISFSPNSQLAAVTSYDGTHIFSTSNWSDIGFVIPTFEGKFTCDSKGLIATAEDQVNVYSVTTGEIIRTIDIASAASVYCLYDGQTIAIDIDDQNNIVTLLSVEP